jgi:hypothetical protein
MRTLIYVPIIHTSADLGSIAKDVTKRGIADLGEEIWQEHRETVNGFWEVISHYFDSLDVSGVKIYQDGMVAEGEVGEKIVGETANAGSKNYELVSRLLKKGAILVKTEDFKLVKEERDRLLSITQAKNLAEKLFGFIKYKLTKDILLDIRDRFIAKRIDGTLNTGEKGIIFIGAYHNIKKRLPKDIQIIEIKDMAKVREYHRLLPFYNKKKERFKELAGYLISEIDQPFYQIK